MYIKLLSIILTLIYSITSPLAYTQDYASALRPLSAKNAASERPATKFKASPTGKEQTPDGVDPAAWKKLCDIIDKEIKTRNFTDADRVELINKILDPMGPKGQIIAIEAARAKYGETMPKECKKFLGFSLSTAKALLSKKDGQEDGKKVVLPSAGNVGAPVIEKPEKPKQEQAGQKKTDDKPSPPPGSTDAVTNAALSLAKERGTTITSTNRFNYKTAYEPDGTMSVYNPEGKPIIGKGAKGPWKDDNFVTVLYAYLNHLIITDGPRLCSLNKESFDILVLMENSQTLHIDSHKPLDGNKLQVNFTEGGKSQSVVFDIATGKRVKADEGAPATEKPEDWRKRFNEAIKGKLSKAEVIDFANSCPSSKDLKDFKTKVMGLKPSFMGQDLVDIDEAIRQRGEVLAGLAQVTKGERKEEEIKVKEEAEEKEAEKTKIVELPAEKIRDEVNQLGDNSPFEAFTKLVKTANRAELKIIEEKFKHKEGVEKPADESIRDDFYDAIITRELELDTSEEEPKLPADAVVTKKGAKETKAIEAAVETIRDEVNDLVDSSSFEVFTELVKTANRTELKIIKERFEHKLSSKKILDAKQIKKNFYEAVKAREAELEKAEQVILDGESEAPADAAASEEQTIGLEKEVQEKPGQKLRPEAAIETAKSKLVELLQEAEKKFNSARTEKEVDDLYADYLKSERLDKLSAEALSSTDYKNKIASLAAVRKEKIKMLNSISGRLNDAIKKLISEQKSTEIPTMTWLNSLYKKFKQEMNSIAEESIGTAKSLYSGDEKILQEIKKLCLTKKEKLRRWIQMIERIRRAPTLDILDTISERVKLAKQAGAFINPAMATLAENRIENKRDKLIQKQARALEKQSSALEEARPALEELWRELEKFMLYYDDFKKAFAELEAAAATEKVNGLDNAVKIEPAVNTHGEIYDRSALRFHHRFAFLHLHPLVELKKPLKEVIAKREKLVGKKRLFRKDIVAQLVTYNTARKAVLEAILNKHTLEELYVSTEQELSDKIDSFMLEHIPAAKGITEIPKPFNVGKDIRTKDTKYLVPLYRKVVLSPRHGVFGTWSFKPLPGDVLKVTDKMIYRYANKSPALKPIFEEVRNKKARQEALEKAKLKQERAKQAEVDKAQLKREKEARKAKVKTQPASEEDLTAGSNIELPGDASAQLPEEASTESPPADVDTGAPADEVPLETTEEEDPFADLDTESSVDDFSPEAIKDFLDMPDGPGVPAKPVSLPIGIDSAIGQGA